MTIRRATPADAEALATLAERTFRDAFEADNSAEDMNEHCQESYSPDRQAREIADPAIETIVATTDEGALAGYAMVRVGTPPAAVQGAAPVELWRIYVDRAYHGRGVAQALLAACVDAARARGGATLWLGVWERNPRALAFYRKMGFVDVGAHVFQLGSDPQTDRIMVRGVE